MKTNITELSHFTTALQNYLADYHPHLLSKYKTILSIMESDFLTIPENKRPSFALKMLNRCKPIFDRYQIEDDFETRSEYSLLCWELLGAIQNYIDTDGIQ